MNTIVPADRISRVSEYYFSIKMKQIREMTESGIDVINLGVGNPDMPPSTAVTGRVIETINNPDAHFYQPYRGIEGLRSAFSEWYWKKYSVSLSPDNEILPLMGSKEGIMHISMAFINSGDGVLIPDPGYPAYKAAAQLCSARCIYYDLKEESGWLPDIEALEDTDLEGIKLMWINYPNMPTGRRASREELTELVKFGHRNRILIVNDNPYSFILNNDPVSILSCEGAMANALELNSLSKSHNMAGWRVGMVGGKSQHIDYVLRVKSNMDSGMFLPIQNAAIKALETDERWYNELNKEYMARRLKVYELMDMLGCTYSKDQSGMFVWGRIGNQWNSSEDFSDALLEKNALFITPGSVFGNNGKEYIRISLCVSIERLNESIRRLVLKGTVTGKSGRELK